MMFNEYKFNNDYYQPNIKYLIHSILYLVKMCDVGVYVQNDTDCIYRRTTIAER